MFGLGGSVWGTDVGKANAMAAQVQAGTVSFMMLLTQCVCVCVCVCVCCVVFCHIGCAHHLHTHSYAPVVQTKVSQLASQVFNCVCVLF